MTCALHVAWDERLTDYHFGPGHPLAPVRVELTMRLAHEFGLWSRPGVTVGAPARATDAELELVHDRGYIAAVRTVSGWAEDLGAHGLEETHLRYARTFGGSTSATMPRSRSPGRWDAAPSASPTWTLTRTTATGCRPRSMTIHGC